MGASYHDLRGFIEAADALGCLRRIDGADPEFELGGITEVAAGTPECPALLFDKVKGHAPGFRVFTNATVSPQRAALALGIDPHLPPLDALKEWKRRRASLKPHAPVTGEARAVPREFARTAARSISESFRRRSGTRATAGRFIGSGSIVVMRDPESGLDQRLDLSRASARPRARHGAVRPWRPARRDHRAEILGARRALPGRGGERARSRALRRRASSICRKARRNTISPAPSRAAPLEIVAAPATGLPVPARRRVRVRGSAPADERGDAARGTVRRVHRILRRGKAPGAGHARRCGPLAQRSDPVGLAADEAAALPFRPAAARGLDLDQSRDGRRHRHRGRLAARGAADDRGGAAARAMPATPSARRSSPRRRATWRASSSRSTRMSIRSDLADVMWAIATRGRALGVGRYRARCVELGARPAHRARAPRRGRDVAFEDDHRRDQAVRLARAVPARLGARADEARAIAAKWGAALKGKRNE